MHGIVMRMYNLARVPSRRKGYSVGLQASSCRVRSVVNADGNPLARIVFEFSLSLQKRHRCSCRLWFAAVTSGKYNDYFKR